MTTAKAAKAAAAKADVKVNGNANGKPKDSTESKRRWIWGQRFHGIADSRAQAIGEELFKIAVEHGLDEVPKLSREVIFERAKDIRSPLHECFEWNKNKAWLEWNLRRAGQLVQSIRYTVVDDGGTTVHIPYSSHEVEDSGGKREYVFVPSTVRNKRLQQERLDAALKGAEEFRHRYDDLASQANDKRLRNVFKIFDLFIANFRKIVEQNKNGGPGVNGDLEINGGLGDLGDFDGADNLTARA